MPAGPRAQITYPEWQKSTEVYPSFATPEYSLWIGPDGGTVNVFCAEPVSAGGRG